MEIEEERKVSVVDCEDPGLEVLSVDQKDSELDQMAMEIEGVEGKGSVVNSNSTQQKDSELDQMALEIKGVVNSNVTEQKDPNIMDMEIKEHDVKLTDANVGEETVSQEPYKSEISQIAQVETQGVVASSECISGSVQACVEDVITQQINQDAMELEAHEVKVVVGSVAEENLLQEPIKISKNTEAELQRVVVGSNCISSSIQVSTESDVTVQNDQDDMEIEEHEVKVVLSSVGEENESQEPVKISQDDNLETSQITQVEAQEA